MIGILYLILIGIGLYSLLPLTAILSRWMLIHWTMFRYEIIDQGDCIEIYEGKYVYVLKKWGMLFFTKGFN